MLILGLDSTAVSASVAVADMENGKVRTYAKFTTRNKMTHSENLLPMIDHVLSIYGTDVGKIGLLAVNAGPGSFTGVRIGVATIKGLAFPNDLPCVGVSTLASLAKNVESVGSKVCALMDARRGQFYYALFENGVRVTPDGEATAEEIAAGLSGEVILCGDGAELFASMYKGDAVLRLAPPECRDQSALSVAICAEELFRKGEACHGKDLRPVYLRLPQAERERLEKQAQSSKE